MPKVSIGIFFGIRGAVGDDWFLVPCRLPLGVLVRCAHVTVWDTFGAAHEIRSCAEKDGAGRNWGFFELTGDDSADVLFIEGPGLDTDDQRASPWLLLPPALAGRTESRPIEEVALLRDEVANLAWAAELRIESTAGRPVDRAARAGGAGAGPGAARRRLAVPALDAGV